MRNFHKVIYHIFPVFVFTIILSIYYTEHAFAQPAFGHPGIAPNWASAKKVQVGTSYTRSHQQNPSHVWFSNAQGILTEVYYPTIDQAQIKDSQFLITDHQSFFVEEKTQTKQEVKVLSPTLVELTNTDYQQRFKIKHLFFTLNDSHTLIDKVTVEMKQDNLGLYLLTNSHINNTGFHDSAFVTPEGFLFKENQTHLQVVSTLGFRQKSVGFVGHSDGFQDLHDDKKMDYFFEKAENGHVAGLGEINLPRKKGIYEFYILYHFSQGSPSTIPLKRDLSLSLEEYTNNWDHYFLTINRPPSLSPDELLFYLRSIYTIKVHEDKLNPGAIVASLSIPWGEDFRESQNQEPHGGYHLVWPRDLFHISLSLILSGDLQTPWSALKFLKKIQFQSDSGSWQYSPLRNYPKQGAFPQNTWVDGKSYWTGLQLDQVSYPVHLFYQLYKYSSQNNQTRLKNEFSTMMVNALNFIKHHGPWSAQERWEENFGISPSTFAAATSALLLGEKLFPEESGKNDWGKTARGWLNKPNDNIDTWTFTTNGFYGDGQYYLRVSGCSHYEAIWNPNINQDCHVANSPLKVDQRKLLDQGFLQLSLLGLRPGGDKKIETSLEKINQNLRIKTPKGHGWYRYSFDAYGDQGKGRLWPILAGEHARYQLEKFSAGALTWTQAASIAQTILQSFQHFSNEGLMIPEQVEEVQGLGTDAATPLVWSHAEYLKLLWSLQEQKNLENPFN